MLVRFWVTIPLTTVALAAALTSTACSPEGASPPPASDAGPSLEGQDADTSQASHPSATDETVTRAPGDLDAPDAGPGVLTEHSLDAGYIGEQDETDSTQGTGFNTDASLSETTNTADETDTPSPDASSVVATGVERDASGDTTDDTAGTSDGDETRTDTSSSEADAGGTGASETADLDSGVSTVDDLSYAADSGSFTNTSETDHSDGGTSPSRLEAVSGYIDIEPVAYTINLGRTEYQSSSARLFYSFFPADNDPDEAPLFVFFNGGPGFATSGGLLSFGTAPHTIGTDLTTPTLERNPSSWAQMGNLLYIDTRQTGFSYSTLSDPSDPNARAAEFGPHNFNEYLDAADLLRVLLRVLAHDDALRDNQVVLVGESYGGVRATLMLYYLITPESLRQQGYYHDPTLADEIEQHYAAISTTSVPATQADQFRTQVLIQPWVAHTQRDDQLLMTCTPGSPEVLVAEEQGVTCNEVLSTNDGYNVNMPAVWSASLDSAAQTVLSDVTQLGLLLGVEPGQIPGFPAEQRLGAYRIGGPPSTVLNPPSSSLVDTYGALPSWDFYHVLFYRSGWENSFYESPLPCALFHRTVQHVDTFVTHAFMDTVVRTSVIPTTLAACNQLYASPPVDTIVLDETPTPGVERPGWMRFQFNANSEIGAAERVVRTPRYQRAGHMVSVTHAAELFADVSEFLEERGVK